MEKTVRADTIAQWLANVVAGYGSKTAITFLREGRIETRLTYDRLQRDVYRLAHTFQNLGVRKGDRVVLFIPKSIIAVVTHFALLAIGALVVPLNPGFKKNEMEYLLGDAEAKLIVVEPEKKALIHSIDPGADVLEVETDRPYREIDFFGSAPDTAPVIDVTAEDPALIIYTSGTTGNPKGAVLTHGNLVCDAGNIIGIWAITGADVMCHCLPLFHVHGLCFALHTAVLGGAHVRLMDQFKPHTVSTELSRRIGDPPCTVFMAVPAMYTKLMDYLGDQKLDFSHLRLITSGSAPLPAKEFERITKVFGLEPVEREGMSETGMNFSNPLDGRRIPGSIGKPLPGLQVRIADLQTDRQVSSGQVGEIRLKSPAITPGYWRKAHETAETFKDGWFRTGDLGKVDADGYYYLTDRIKHIIISGGENISAKEVETVIDQLEGVNESAVVGKPDDKWGEKVVAAVALKPEAGLTATIIQSHCRKHLHDWKCPKEIIFLDEIPRNTMGKMLKEEVKKIFMSA